MNQSNWKARHRWIALDFYLPSRKKSEDFFYSSLGWLFVLSILEIPTLKLRNGRKINFVTHNNQPFDSIVLCHLSFISIVVKKKWGKSLAAQTDRFEAERWPTRENETMDETMDKT